MENENRKKGVAETKIFVVGICSLWDKMIFNFEGWDAVDLKLRNEMEFETILEFSWKFFLDWKEKLAAGPERGPEKEPEKEPEKGFGGQKPPPLAKLFHFVMFFLRNPTLSYKKFQNSGLNPDWQSMISRELATKK